MTPDPPAKPEGVLIVDKPLHWSSMRAVSFVRHRAMRAKTGHAGTLDPLATGVLVLALGKATKIIERMMATEKRYRTTIDLSAYTESGDLESERIPVTVSTPPDFDRVREVLESMTGDTMQRPPLFSAMQVDGKRAYLLARKGSDITLPERPITIHALHIVRYEWPELEIDVHCSKGTYIRSLARDIGLALDAGGCCTALRRTAVGPFDVSMARTPDELAHGVSQDDLISIEDALALLDSQCG